MLNPATLNGAVNNIQETPKLEGFQRCRPRYLRTYLVAMEIIAHSAYGQNIGDLIRMLTLMPVI